MTVLFYFSAEKTAQKLKPPPYGGGLGLSAEIPFGSSFCPALFAVNRSVCSWFKRKFGDFYPAV
jgi:hypothetical protein